MNKDDLLRRTKEFAHRGVKLCLALPQNDKHLKIQLIKCSTSAVANYSSSCVAPSKSHFASKLSIVIEEIDESCFWLEFIINENLLSEKQIMPLLNESKELKAIFIASRNTVKNRTLENLSKGLSNRNNRLSTIIYQSCIPF